jgi:UDP-N-acetylglucosamine--N-acetylmuramyl-(pentapeptide) pyrophosphoryl-undecaprenol N-acetylglucosamine transferase
MSLAPRRIVLAGGGTGGHVIPALALGEVLRERGDAVLFLGTRRGLETRLVPAAGFELVALGSRPLVGRSLAERVAAVASLAVATFSAWRALRSFRAELVLSVGGYAAVPVALAAWLTGIPVALLEPNAVPGQANRLAARFARLLFVAFPAAGEALGRGPGDPRLRVSGVPLRRALREAFASRSEAPQASAAARRLFVFGGSQGARQINDALLGTLPDLDATRIEIVHQTGESDRARVADAYAKAGFRAEVIAFEPDMASRYLWADLVLCRAGAMTVAELALAGRAALLVPLAHVGGGEQGANARELERAGAALVLDGGRLAGGELSAALRGLLADPARLQRMGACAARLARPEAAQNIVEECHRLLARGEAS